MNASIDEGKAQTMKTDTLTLEEVHRINAYWRASNYVSVSQINPYCHPALKRPLELADIQH